MSLKLCCCLCWTSCSDYQILQTDLGDCNDAYEIIVKYFDPMLLTEHINSKGCRVLCLNCWLHIKEFDEFHQNVMKTRSSLEQINIQNFPLCISVVLCNQNVHTGAENQIKLKDVSIKNNSDNEQNPLEGNIDMLSLDDDEEDCDKKPLIELLKPHLSVDIVKENCNDVEKANMRKDTIKSRKSRRSKITPKEIPKLDSYGNGETIITKDEISEIQPNSNPRIHPALDKFRKHNKFIAEWKPQLECDICSETFSSFDLLKVHFNDIHKSRCYVKCCERQFFRRCSLVEHIRLHINPEIHKCDICGKLSASKYNKRTIHEGVAEQFECKVCQKPFKQKPNLERHLLTHATGSKDFKCNACDKAYVLEVQLKTHIKMIHNDSRVCDQCGKTINGSVALKKHLEEHAGIKKPKYPCDECGTVLVSRSSLKSHKAAYHSDGTTVYVCSICGKVSGSERGLLNHRKFVHELERKHKCPHCDKGFKRPLMLQEHIASHTGEALYQCPHCPRTFKRSSKYHDHRKKSHRIEWEKSRTNRLEKQKIDFEQVTNQVVL